MDLPNLQTPVNHSKSSFFESQEWALCTTQRKPNTEGSFRGLRVLGVRAAELVHEAGDHAVEVQAVVVPPGRPLLARPGNHRIKPRNPAQVQNERFLIRGLPTGAC